MRFLTYNLWHGLSPLNAVAFETLEPTTRRVMREALQIEVIRKFSPDVSFFQEVNPVVTRARELSRGLQFDYQIQPDLSGLKVMGWGLPLNLHSGLSIMAAKTHPLKKVRSVSLLRPAFNWVRTWGSWQLQEERFALFCETMVPGWGRVLLVNTHLHHGIEATPQLLEQVDKLSTADELHESFFSELKDRIYRPDKRRRSELAILLKVVDELESRYAGVVLCGDFNAEPTNGVFDDLKTRGFRDAWAEVHPESPGLTYDKGKNPANHKLQERFPVQLMVEDLTFSADTKEKLFSLARAHDQRPRRIDYLWYRSTGASVRAEKVELVGLPNTEGLAPSDHFGLGVELKVG